VYPGAHPVLGLYELADEAVQQTFVRAWHAADRFVITRNPAPWLATIARRVAIDIQRSEGRRPTISLAGVATDDRAVVSRPPDLETLATIWHVRRAIDTLPPDEATIVRLSHLEGMTHAQIAEKLGIALGTVKSRSHRAHRKLATLLGHLREPLA
jgi:RNA polymerase sigma-70 factor (ECF subfamily)